MARTVFDVLDGRLQELISASQNALCTGAAKDFPLYREMCGVIQGLATAQREVRALAQQHTDDDDD